MEAVAAGHCQEAEEECSRLAAAGEDCLQIVAREH